MVLKVTCLKKKNASPKYTSTGSCENFAFTSHGYIGNTTIAIVKAIWGKKR